MGFRIPLSLRDVCARRERGQGGEGLFSWQLGTLIPNPFSLSARTIRQGEGARNESISTSFDGWR